MTEAQSISLNGEWEFAPDPENKYRIESLADLEWRRAEVPLSWQAQFEDLRDYQGVAWYKKTLSLHSPEPGKIMLLVFNAVDYISEVFVNKRFAGKHEGGYTPFRFDITPFLKEGSNEIIVRVMDPVNDENGTEGISYRNIPHGKQSWYVQTSGIWQDVNLLIKPEIYIQSMHVTADIEGSFRIKIIFNKAADEEKYLKIRITGKFKNIVWNEAKKISIPKELNVAGKIRNPQLWSFDSPDLYTIEAELGGDHYTDKFGLRSIEAKDKKLYLNGRQFYLIAALDQDFYPETIYTSPSEEFIRDEMVKAKQLGLNMLRCHIKAPDPLYLKAADEIGLLVWYEIPNWDVFSDEAASRASMTIDEMLERDWNHPSLVIISLINESWGIDLREKEQREWLLNEFNRVKEKAVGRIVVDNSACYGNFHLKSDLNDYHTYWSIPDNKNKFNETVDEVAKRPKWLFSMYGDSKETGNEPLLISEFGNWGLPKLPQKLPWWIERKFLDFEVSLPLGYEKRLNEYKYEKIFQSYDELAEESQRAQSEALKYEIETIRMNPEIQGYVITEFTDINWECNGLLDMWRNFKKCSDVLPLIQHQDVIIPRPVKYNYYDNEEAQIKIFISHFGSQDFKDAVLKWKTAGGISGIINIQDAVQGNVIELPDVSFKIAERRTAGNERIHFELLNNGKIIAENFADIYAYPAGLTQLNYSINVYDPVKKLSMLAGLLKEKVAGGKSSSVIVTNVIDDWIISNLHDGGNVICIIDSGTVLPESSAVKIVSRNSDWYDGNWASNLNWNRKENPVFNNVVFSKSFGFQSAQSTPGWVLTGIPAVKFGDVLAGMFAGWIHLNSGYIVRMMQGDGKLIFCSFPIAENYGRDPFAFHLFNNLVSYICSDKYESNFPFIIK